MSRSSLSLLLRSSYFNVKEKEVMGMAVREFPTFEEFVQFQHDYAGQLVPPGLLAKLCNVPQATVKQWVREESDCIAYAYRSSAGASFVLIPLEQSFLAQKIDAAKIRELFGDDRTK